MKNDRRVRLKGGGLRPVTGTIYYSWPSTMFDPHPNPLGFKGSSTIPYRSMRYMVDTVGFKQDDFNPCFHDRYTGVHNFPSYYAVTDEEGNTHSRSYSWSAGLHDPILDCRQLDIPLGSWIEDFSARAENHFLVLVDTAFSPVNFLIEMIQILEGNVKLLDGLRKTISGAIERFRLKFKETGNYWLSWNFGIKPVISDVKNALNVYRKALKRLKWLRERNHKDTKVHYREGPRQYEWTNDFTLATVNQESPHFDPYPGPGPLYMDWADWITIDRKATADCWAEVRLSAWAWIRFDIPDMLLEGVEGLGIVLSAMQGLYNPLQIAWDAIPYSWLIDWFRTEAHKLRETLKSDLSPLGVATIKEAGWSMKCRVLGKYFSEVRAISGRTGTPTPLGPYVRTECGAFRYLLFCRQPKLPIVGDWPFTVPWKWYNASILSALIEQKRRRM